MAADMSVRLDWLPAADALRSIELIARSGLPVRPPEGMKVDDFRNLMSLDKKVASGKLRLVLMRQLGDAVVSGDFDPAAVDDTLRHYSPKQPENGAAPLPRRTRPIPRPSPPHRG